ncbi:MAG: hypothetical protein R3350_07165 [Saprospiraceae bacterium]|nr:hypothetical protein [Saprospiraceae bacterium]
MPPRERYGIIDLGTNTFHLLIVEGDRRSFRELRRVRKFVKLAEGGMDLISPEAFRRGIDTLRQFEGLLKEENIDRVRAIGTAALRSAANGAEFLRRAREETSLDISLISGDEEARLIHLGVKQAVPFGEETRLIIDIGGGSVEFILADRGGVHWARSFPTGLAVLYRKFHRSDPIDPAEIETLRRSLEREFAPLVPALRSRPVRQLVGAAGAFEVLEKVLPVVEEIDRSTRLSPADFHRFCERMVRSTLAERLAMPEIPHSRADMIVVSSLLIEYVLQLASIEDILVSPYALKEGVLWEMMTSPQI